MRTKQGRDFIKGPSVSQALGFFTGRDVLVTGGMIPWLQTLPLTADSV